MKKLFLVSLFIFSLGCNLNNPITEFNIEEISEEIEEKLVQLVINVR